MKKLILASALVLSVCAFSCKSDDDSSSSGDDCVTCNVGGGLSTKACYNEGDDFYTVTVDLGPLGSESTEFPIDSSEDWDDIKADFCD